GHDEWVPTLGLVLPADGALRLAAHLATVPDDERDDDEAVVTFCAREGYPVVATLPHLLEHGDGPSLAGNDAHGARHATVPAGDAVDPDAWDRPGLDRAPARTPATARPVAVTLDRSRCPLRVLRPHAGEPLEHPFGRGWDAWAWWLGGVGLGRVGGGLRRGPGRRRARPGGTRRGGVARARSRPARRAHRAGRGVLAPGVRRRAPALARARRSRGARPPRGRGPDVGAV